MAQKYRELRKREKAMDEFLTNFDATKQTEIEQLQNSKRTIVNYLEVISKVLQRTAGNQTSRNNKKNRDNVDDDDNVTQADLRKVEELEKKVTTQLDILKEKKKTMDEELIMFSDLEGLKRKSEARKDQLLVEKQNLSRYRDSIKYELQSLQSQLESIHAQLYDNETHTQLTNLEKRLQQLEQSNFSAKEHLSSVSAETDYEHLKSQVMILVNEHNNWLQKQILNPSNY
jgi:hypothetical protein